MKLLLLALIALAGSLPAEDTIVPEPLRAEDVADLLGLAVVRFSLHDPKGFKEVEAVLIEVNRNGDNIVRKEVARTGIRRMPGGKATLATFRLGYREGKLLFAHDDALNWTSLDHSTIGKYSNRYRNLTQVGEYRILWYDTEDGTARMVSEIGKMSRFIAVEFNVR